MTDLWDKILGKKELELRIVAREATVAKLRLGQNTEQQGFKGEVEDL